MSRAARVPYRLRPAEIDRNWRLTIPALIRIMQDAAWVNADSLNASVANLHDEGITWAMIRMRMEFERLPRHPEELIVETYPSGNEKVLVYRDYQVEDVEGKPLARATSTWMVVDLNTRRMTRLPDHFRSIVQLPEGKMALPRAAGKFGHAVNGNPVVSTPVLWSHLDPNGHLGNPFYYQFALEALGPDFLENHAPLEMEMVIRAESLHGDVLDSYLIAEEELVFQHLLLRKSDGKILAQGRSRWKIEK